MYLKSFRIQNFRSIVDTGIVHVSPDGIALLIGQNESGKTSILEALEAFEEDTIYEDDIRTDGKMPEISCAYIIEDVKELRSLMELDWGSVVDIDIEKAINKAKEVVIIKTWDKNNYGESLISLGDKPLKDIFQKLEESAHQEREQTEADTQPSEEQGETNPETKEGEAPSGNTESTDTSNENENILSETSFAEEFFRVMPLITLFEDNSLLPKEIDLKDLKNKNSKADGFFGARNYIEISGLDLDELEKGTNKRIVEDKIDKANAAITREFQKYWTQTLGKKSKISLKMELDHHKSPGKQGQPYLTFWILDKSGKLYPVQRSKGVRWFISFYLQLEATAKNKTKRIFLIDEPGANLHAKAQEDILKVFEKLKNEVQIIFATHSPYLVDVDKVYRVLAVEREDQEDDSSVTKVLSFQDLGSASSDTLLPLYTNMKVDISHQSVIDRRHNVVLEEISAFFYFKALWKLLDTKKIVHFLPATGCSNIPMLANLILGWGLEFMVVVDDDAHGRRVCKELEEACVLPKEKIIRIMDCNGIEDIFSSKDFGKLVLNQKGLSIPSKNSEYIKSRSKVLTARDFMLRVEKGEVKFEDFSKQSQDKIKDIIQKIVDQL